MEGKLEKFRSIFTRRCKCASKKAELGSQGRIDGWLVEIGECLVPRNTFDSNYRCSCIRSLHLRNVCLREIIARNERRLPRVAFWNSRMFALLSARSAIADIRNKLAKFEVHDLSPRSSI